MSQIKKEAENTKEKKREKPEATSAAASPGKKPQRRRLHTGDADAEDMRADDDEAIAAGATVRHNERYGYSLGQ